MTLDDYLKGDESQGLPRVTEAKLAVKVGCNQATINRIRNGQRPSAALATAIFTHTDGKVTPNDLFDIAALEGAVSKAA